MRPSIHKLGDIRHGAIYVLFFVASIILANSRVDAVGATLSCNRPCEIIARDPIPAGSNLELTWTETGNYLPSRFDIVLAWGLASNALTTLIAFLNYTQPVQNATAQTYTTSITLPSNVPSGDYYWIMITPHDVANYSVYATNFGPYHIYGSDVAPSSMPSAQYPFKIDVVCGNNLGQCGGANIIQPGAPLLVSWSYSAMSFQASIFWGNPDLLGLNSVAVVQLFPYTNTMVASNRQNTNNYSISVSTQSLLHGVPPGLYYYVGVVSTGSSASVRSFAGPFTIRPSGYSSQASRLPVTPAVWLAMGTIVLHSLMLFSHFPKTTAPAY
ncbi:hypothetical protein BX666DRAFT_938034 [Dichotomocladium elegans]|nr:hypothetical protein BX666DRAFT_938034 [Dichotomocladium elegans]